MSKKNEELTTIDSMDLIQVNGGREDTVTGQLTVPGGSGSVTGSTRTTNYESCLANNQRMARERHPDNRWFWQRWRGDADTNAGPRADYERDNIGRCTVP